MFSNFQLITSIVLVLTVLMSGCHVKVGEKPPPPKVQQFNGTKCLSRVTPYLADFIDGKTTDQQVNEIWTCFSTALDKFRKYVRGSSEDQYSSQELATFLQDNFLDKNPQQPKVINPTLQAEFMKLKQMFVGGNADFLTMDDLDRAIDVLESFRQLSLGINPYMKVFALNWSASANDKADDDIKYFEDANAAVQVFAKDLSGLIKKNHRGYNLMDFVVLCRELSDINDKPWASLAKIEKYMPVVQKIKKATSGGLESTVAPSEWRSFLLMSARGYVQFLRYHYFIDTSQGEWRTSRLSYIARTFEDGFSVFQDLVKEKPSGVVTREEIDDLFTALSKAWSNFKTSDRLVLELMKVKRLLIGGSLEAFTTDDFATASLKVGRLKVLIEKSLTYSKVYGKVWNPAALSQQDAQGFFRKAQINLSDVFAEFGALLESDYDLESINLLVNELVTLYPKINDGREAPLEEIVRKLTPIVVDAKNMAFNDDSSVLKKTQWPGFLRSLANGYSLYLYQHYFMNKLDLQTSRGLRRLDSFADQTLQLLREMMGLNSSARFRLEDINSLTEKIARAYLLPDKLDAEVMRMGMSLFANRVLLAPELRLRGKYPNALNIASLDALGFELKLWIQQELFFTTLFKDADETYSLGQIQRIFAKKYNESGLSKEFNAGLKEMTMALDSDVPMTLTSKGYLVISGRLSQRYSQQSLSQLNLNRSAARLLTRSFANDLKRITSYKGFNLSEAQRAFKELRPIAMRLGLLDSDSKTFAESRFQEANIFTPAANGDGYVSFKEATQLVGMVWSGVNLNAALAKELQQSCLGGHRYSRDTLVSVQCVIQVYSKEMRVHMKTSLPEHVKYMNAIGSDVWGDYLNNVLKSAGYVPNSSGKAKMRDIALAVHVIQYIEMMFAKYDKDNNYFVDTKEALTAFPVFHDLIKDFAGGAVGDNDLNSVFTYILRYGKPPETPYEKMQFLLNWKGKPQNWDVQAERTLISRIMGYIADQTNR